jgi:hypothetical protein
LQVVLDKINSIVTQANQITVAAKQQFPITGKIGSNILQFAEAIQGTAKWAREDAPAAGQLFGLAEEMPRGGAIRI